MEQWGVSRGSNGHNKSRDRRADNPPPPVSLFFATFRTKFNTLNLYVIKQHHATFKYIQNTSYSENILFFYLVRYDNVMFEI